MRVGLIETNLGRREEAIAAFRLARDEYEKLASDFPEKRLYREFSARSQHNLGMSLEKVNALTESEKQLRKSLEINEKLAKEFPENLIYRRDLGTTHQGLGILLDGQKRWPEAEEEFRRALEFRQHLVERNPLEEMYLLELAQTHTSLGSVLDHRGRLQESIEYFLNALGTKQKLVDQFPNRQDFRANLSTTHNGLGILFLKMGKMKDAQEQFRSGQTVLEKLVADYPVAIDYQVQLGGSYCNYGMLVRDAVSPNSSLEWFEKAIRILTGVYEKNRSSMQARLFLRNSYWNRASAFHLVQKFPEAVEDWDKAIELSPQADQWEMRLGRAGSLVQSGRVDRAIAEANELSKRTAWQGQQWYDMACIYSVASGKISDEKQKYADRAMECLQTAVKKGFGNSSHMNRDADLDPIRDRKDYKELIHQLEKK